MFKLMVQGKTFKDLKEKLQEAADSIVTEQSDGVEEMYAAPQEPGNFMTDFREPASGHHAVHVPDEAPVVVDNDDEVGPANGDASVDSKGRPWDERIHASSRALNKDGTWRYRRGVDDATIAKVESTETAVHVAPSFTPSIVPPVPDIPMSAPIDPKPFTSPQAPQQEPAPAAAPTPIAPAPYETVAVPQTSTKPAHTLDTFKANFIQVMSGLVMTKVIDQNYINQLNAHFKVANLWEVSKNDAAMTEMFDNLVQFGMITKVG